MSHHTVWTCDRCGTETHALGEVTEVEVRRQEQVGARIGKAQHDLCADCGEDLRLFMAGTSVDAAAPLFSESESDNEREEEA